MLVEKRSAKKLIHTVCKNCRKIKHRHRNLNQGIQKSRLAWDAQTTIVDHPWVAFFPHQSKAQLVIVSVKKSQNLQRGEMRNILNIWIFINQNVQRGEMRNEKCTFDPGSDMIHLRQNVTFFGTAYILHFLQVHITTYLNLHRNH